MIILSMKLTEKDKIIEESFGVKLVKARECKCLGKYQEAIDRYGKVLFMKENSDVLIELAEIYQKIYDISTAILLYRKSLQFEQKPFIKQKLRNLSLIKGLQLLQIGSTKNILIDTDFQPFAKRYPLFHKTLLQKTKQNNQQSNKQFQLCLLSTLAYLQVNQRQLAMTEIDKYLKINDKNADILILKGILYWSLIENKKGYECFWRAYKIQPEHEQIKVFLQTIIPQVEQLYKQCKYELISKDYAKCRLKVKKALQMYPHHTKFLILSSYLYRIKQQYQQALGELETANRTLEKHDEQLQNDLRNQISLTYNQMGVYLYKHFKYQQAIKLFTEGLSYTPSDWNMYSNRADCYKGLNNLINALEDYLKAYQIEKKNQSLNYKLSNIYNLRGISLFNSKNYQNAIQQFNISIKFYPKCPIYYLSKAKCYIQIGLKNQAIACLNQALTFQPNNFDVLQLMSQLNQQNDKKVRNNRKVIVLSKQK